MTWELALALITAASLVIVAVLLRRSRVPRALVISLGAGVSLAAAGFGAGMMLLPVSDPPQASLGAIGFVPPQHPLPGKGFAVGVAVNASGCSNPVQVSVVVAGTRDYWAEHPSRRSDPRWSSFALTLPGTGLSDVRVGFAHRATDLTSPEQAEFWTPGPGQIQTARPVLKSGQTIVSGRVANWKRSLQPVLLSFRANWLSRRGLSSCYLQLPVLTGALTASAAQLALTKRQLRAYETPGSRAVVQSGHTQTPYTPALDITHGTLTVTVAGGEVIPDASVPAPQTLVDGNTAWTCRSIAESTGKINVARRSALPDVLLGTTGAGYSEGFLERLATGNCRGVAAIAQDSATYSRDLVLLAVGAVISLGITLLIQAILNSLADGGREARRRNARHTQQPARADGEDTVSLTIR
jgi:hypothetical protein